MSKTLHTSIILLLIILFCFALGYSTKVCQTPPLALVPMTNEQIITTSKICWQAGMKPRFFRNELTMETYKIECMPQTEQP